MNRLFLAFVALAFFMAGGCGRKPAAPATASSVEALDVKAPSPLDAPFRYRGGEPLDIDALFATFPDYLRPRYEKAEFDKKLGATVATNLQFGDGEDGFTAARAEFFGVDLAAAERVRTAKDAGPDAPMERLFEKVRLYGLESARDHGDGSMRVGALEIDRLRVRQGGVPTDPQGSGLAALVNAFDVAGVYFKDVELGRAGRDGDASEADFAMSAPDLRLVGIGAGNLDAVIARKLDFRMKQPPEALERAGREAGAAGDLLLGGPLRAFIAPDNQRTKLDLVDWRGISFSGLMPYALVGETPPASARSLIDLGTARLVGAETFIAGRRVSRVPETEISAMEFAWLRPSKIRALTRGAEVDFTGYLPASDKEAIAELKKRGLDRVRGDSDLAYDWRPDSGASAFSTGFKSDGFADFDLDVALEGPTLQQLAAARTAGDAQPAGELSRLKSFSLVIDDDAMLEAFFALAALESGGSAKDVRKAAPAFLRLAAGEAGRSSPPLGELVTAVADFVEEGGTLTISARPEPPLPLSAIAAPSGAEDSLSALNLKSTRKP